MINKAHYPSYYRNHVYSHQFNMPDSAFHNRKIPQYISQLPQGQSSFFKSNKKHYKDIGYKSLIGEQNIINNQSYQQSYSPAKNKSYLRNLNITDIEGTNPNTILSQAVRNRIKAKENILKQQKKKVIEIEKYTSNFNKQRNQEQQLQKMMRDQNRRRIKTQQNDNQLNSYHYNRPNPLSYKQELKINEEETEDLKKKLASARQKAQSLKYTLIENTNNQKTQKLKQKIKNNSFIKLQPIVVSNKSQIKQQKDIISPLQNIKEQQRRYNKNIYPQKDYIIQQDSDIRNKMKEILKDNQQLKYSNKQLRGQIRKLNPTHLSIDMFSNPFYSNLNAKNIRPT